MRSLGPMPGYGSGPAGRGRRQAMPVQPAPQRPVRGDLGVRGDPGQFGPDAGRTPTRMLAAEIQDRLQQRWVRARVATAIVIAGGQIGQGLITSLRLEGASRQVSNRA
jgi:hypothetical protein